MPEDLSLLDLPSTDPPDDPEGVVSWLIGRGKTSVRAVLNQNVGQGYEFLHNFEDLAEFSMEAVREMFGGGKYQVRFRRPNGTFVTSIVFRISGPTRAVSATPAEDPRMAHVESELAELKALLREKATGGGGQDLTQLIVGLATAMSTSQAAVMGPLLTALVDRERPQTSMTEQLEVMARLMELARDGNGGGGGYGDVIKGLGVPVMQMLSRFAGAEMEELPPGGELPAPAPSSPPPGGAPPPGWLTALRPLLPGLLQLAQMHGDVEWWSRKIVGDATPEQLTWITGELERGEDFEAEFYAWVPEAVPHKEWFDGWWDALADLLLEEEGTDDDGDGGTDGHGAAAASGADPKPGKPAGKPGKPGKAGGAQG